MAWHFWLASECSISAFSLCLECSSLSLGLRSEYSICSVFFFGDYIYIYDTIIKWKNHKTKKEELKKNKL